MSEQNLDLARRVFDAFAAVVVIGRVLGRGGGMILDRPTGWVYKMRDGRIVRSRVYGSQAEALEAAGD